MRKLLVWVSLTPDDEPVCLLRRYNFPRKHLEPACGGIWHGVATLCRRGLRNGYTTIVKCAACKPLLKALLQRHERDNADVEKAYAAFDFTGERSEDGPHGEGEQGERLPSGEDPQTPDPLDLL